MVACTQQNERKSLVESSVLHDKAPTRSCSVPSALHRFATDCHGRLFGRAGEGCMDETSREIAAEASALLGLAIPTLLIQFSFAAPPFLTASFIGRRFGLVYLGAYQLAFMIINLFTLSLLTGLFSASDTLTPQAFGAGNHREVGVIALRGFLGSLALVLPICFLLGAYLSDLFVALGVDPESSELAGVWYRIYVVALPFYGLYLALWKFLSAQNVMWPLIVSSLVSTCIILPVAMSLLVRAFGFEGSAMAFALYQVCQGLGVLVILIVYRPYHAACWPGLNEAWKEVFRWEPFVKFFHLGLGGIVATSEGIYWQTISLGIGTLGVVPLSVHTVPSQFLTLAFMMAFGIGVSLSVRLGVTLPRNVRRAKQLVWGTYLVSGFWFGLGSWALYRYRRYIYRIFTTDPLIMAGCEEIWGKVCLYFFLVSWFALSTGVANGLGKQWTLGLLLLGIFWCFGVPSLWYYGIDEAESLNVVWKWINPPYVFINLALLVVFVQADWDEISMDICKREGIVMKQVDHLGPYGITYGSVENERQLFVEAACKELVLV